MKAMKNEVIIKEVESSGIVGQMSKAKIGGWVVRIYVDGKKASMRRWAFKDLAEQDLTTSMNRAVLAFEKK